MIDDTNDIDEAMINKWNSVYPILLEKHVERLYKIDPSVANKYIHDFEGLLLSIGVTTDMVYPHIIVNGYASSREYNGSIKDIILINRSTIIKYIELFK